MNIPQGYKQTELGIIPEDWEYSPSLKYLKEISMGPFGSDIKVENFVGFGIPVLNGANLQSYRLIDRFENYVTSQKAAALKKAVANKGDIIITHRGTLGQVTYIPKSAKFDRYVISQSQFRVRFNECIDSEFIVRYLLSPIGQECLLEFKGHTGVPALAQPTTNFRNLPLLIPPIAEQRAIAEVLSDVDGLIAALDKKIAKKRLLKQGAMQQLLTGKKRLPGFTDEWETNRLGDWATMNSGGTPTSSVQEYYNGHIPFLSISDITEAGKYINKTEKTITEKGLNNSSARMFPAGTIMYAMYASLGKCSIANIELSCSQAILGITPKCRINPEYLYYYLSFIEEDVRDMGQTGTQSNLSKQIVQGFMVKLPSDIKEQQAIATILSDMDKEIADLEAQRDKYRLLQSGMMQKLLTGQIRLKTE